MKKDYINGLLWAVYLALLAVLLPHTAWAFGRFEPGGTVGLVTSWAAAFAFEAAIAALTHKLARHIEQIRGRKRLIIRRYGNAYAAGLVIAMSVSALANLAHAVEFGGTLEIFARWGVPFGVYATAFGGILPLVSLLFARVLSNVVEAEQEVDGRLVEANKKLTEIRRHLREANQRADAAELRFAAAGDLIVIMSEGEKRKKILAARQKWPLLPPSSVAIVAEASPSYTSEVLSTESM